MVIVGVAGEKGSGKDTFCTLLEKRLHKFTVEKIRFSDVLGETLDEWFLPKTRHNLQRLAIVMDAEYGKGTLCEATKQRVVKSKADVVLLMGIRWSQDVEMLRSFEKSVFLYVTADVKVRWMRTRTRGEKSDEGTASYKQFVQEEKVQTEVDIAKLGEQADYVIENNNDMSLLEESVEEIAQSIVNL